MKYVVGVLIGIILIIVIAKAFSDPDKTKTTSEIERKLSADSASSTTFTKLYAVDSAAEAKSRKENEKVINTLKPKFRVKKDEFSESVLITPKSAPQFVNYNGVYFFFSMDGETVGDLRLRIQYLSDSWLFIKHYIFNVDGTNYEVYPAEVERDHQDGETFEWSNVVYFNNAELFEALATAKKVKVKFIGDQYHDVKTLSSSQISAFADTYKYFKALGGKK